MTFEFHKELSLQLECDDPDCRGLDPFPFSDVVNEGDDVATSSKRIDYINRAKAMGWTFKGKKTYCRDHPHD